MAVAEKTENSAAEPTMEEILASIRRIISEDGATVESAPPPPDSILDLTEMLEAEAAPPPRASAPPPPEAPIELEMASADLEVVMEDSVPEMPVPEIPTSAPEPVGADERLVSEVTAQATASMLGNLSQGSRSSGEGLPMGNGGRTLESMVMELIRPVLKEWLDRNLPTLVERVVQKEIRKITRDVG